jgi:hypothetical protein
MAEKLGFPVLPGSDPFPFASQVERVGTFGFVLPEWEDNEDMPARTLLRRLRDLHASPSYFGSLTGLGRFTVSQVRMQIHNRLRATPAPV